MKQLTCEMCGSSDLIKQDGVYVCQSCGTKYSIEEAKKMMIEGPVDVSGSKVKIDSTDALDNLYLLARRAKSSNNYADAAKYYGIIVQQDPNSWEANFGYIYYTAVGCTIGQIESATNSVQNSLGSIFKMIDTYEEENKKDDSRIEVYNSVLSLADLLANAAQNTHQSLCGNMTTSSAVYSSVMSDYFNRTGACIRMLMILAQNMIAVYKTSNNNKYKEWAVIALKKANLINADVCQNSLYRNNPSHLVKMKEIEDIITKSIKVYETNYTGPLENIIISQRTASQNSGCYVATAVYGSYDCPPVWTLRRYRDYTLDKTWYGRAFIRIYYAISPTLVKWFGHTEWFKKMWKGKLDRMVEKLQKNGVEDTPYEDRKW